VLKKQAEAAPLVELDQAASARGGDGPGPAHDTEFREDAPEMALLLRIQNHHDIAYAPGNASSRLRQSASKVSGNGWSDATISRRHFSRSSNALGRLPWFGAANRARLCGGPERRTSTSELIREVIRRRWNGRSTTDSRPEPEYTPANEPVRSCSSVWAALNPTDSSAPS
jgi:hypothetical protein